MKAVFKVFDWLEEIAMVIGMSIMVVVNFLNVVSRYLLPQSPFSFTEELTVLMFLWVTMFGVACAYKRHSHTGLTLITDLLPRALQKIFILLAGLASIIMLAILFYMSVLMVQGQIASGQIMTALKWPEYVRGLAIPVGAAFILVRSIQVTISDGGLTMD